MQSGTCEKDLAEIKGRKLTEDELSTSQMCMDEPGGGSGWLASRGVARANSTENNDLQGRATKRATLYIPKGYRVAYNFSQFHDNSKVEVEEDHCEHVWGAWTYSDEQPDGLVYLWRKCYICPETQIY